MISVLLLPIQDGGMLFFLAGYEYGSEVRIIYLREFAFTPSSASSSSFVGKYFVIPICLVREIAEVHFLSHFLLSPLYDRACSRFI